MSDETPIVTADPDGGGYVAYIPAWPGVCGQGRTPGAARRDALRAKKMIEFWALRN